MGIASWIIWNLFHHYKLVYFTEYGSAVLKRMNVKAALSGTVVFPFFDGLSVPAVSPRRLHSTDIAGTTESTPHPACTRPSSGRKSPNIYEGIPTFRVGTTTTAFRNEAHKTSETEPTPTPRYGKLTTRKPNKAIQESDIATLTGYTTHM